jgi:hypothetical protein
MLCAYFFNQDGREEPGSTYLTNDYALGGVYEFIVDFGSTRLYVVEAIDGLTALFRRVTATNSPES